MNPVTLINGRRITTVDSTLSDGTFIPAGCHIAVPSYGVGMDPDYITEPSKFDGFRWSKIREAQPDRAHGLAFASSSSINQTYFGTGKHICAGRFFISDTLKILLVLILTKYDFALAEPQKGRPKNFEIDWSVVPNLSAKILMRRIQSPDI